MVDALKTDYAKTTAMVFGTAPVFDDIVTSATKIERILNDGT
jgi:hypothetical protein